MDTLEKPVGTRLEILIRALPSSFPLPLGGIIETFGSSPKIEFRDKRGKAIVSLSALAPFDPMEVFPDARYNVICTAPGLTAGRRNGRKRYTRHDFDLLSDRSWRRRLKARSFRYSLKYGKIRRIPVGQRGTTLPKDAVEFMDGTEETFVTMHSEEKATAKLCLSPF